MILNLTQHAASTEQLAAGVVDLPQTERKYLSTVLTFEDIPDGDDIWVRADMLANLALEWAEEGDSVMIGGAPFLMNALERALVERGLKPVHAFSRRESVDEHLPDGSVRKTNVFRHVGFVEA